MAHDNFVEGLIVPRKPWIGPILMNEWNARHSGTHTELSIVSIPSSVDRNEGRVCITVFTTSPGHDVRDVACGRRGKPSIGSELCNLIWWQYPGVVLAERRWH